MSDLLSIAIPPAFCDLILTRPVWSDLRWVISLREPSGGREFPFVFTGGAVQVKGKVWCVTLFADVLGVQVKEYGRGESLRESMLDALACLARMLGALAGEKEGQAKRARIDALKKDFANRAAEFRAHEEVMRTLMRAFPDVWPAP